VMAHWRHPLDAGEQAELCALVHVAHLLAVGMGFTAGGDTFVVQIDEWAQSLLDLRIAEFEILVAQAYEAIDNLSL